MGGVSPNHVGIIDPKTNEIVEEIQVGLRPGPVAVGDGAAWIGNLDDQSLTKIDVGRRVSAGTFSLDNRTPTGIAVGETVWVAHGALGQLSAVDPEFGQVTKTIDVAGEALGSTNGSVATGADAVWAVYGDSTLARVDPIDIEVTGKTVTGTAPAGIVVAYGYVWVVNTDSATVQRFDPATFDAGPLGTATSVGLRPTAIAAGRRCDLGGEHRCEHRHEDPARYRRWGADDGTDRRGRRANRSGCRSRCRLGRERR